MPESPFTGRWEITSSEVWSDDALSRVRPATLMFREDGSGTLAFVGVQGEFDGRLGERDGKPLVEFSWAGTDARRRACGRGWFTCEGDTLTGRIFIHFGDDSGFTAQREGSDSAAEG